MCKILKKQIIIFNIWVIIFSPSSYLFANPKLEKAQEFYDNLDIDNVLPLLHEALNIAKNVREKIKIYELMGFVYVILDQDKLAHETFLKLLELEPNYVLPNSKSPKIKSILKFAKAENTRCNNRINLFIPTDSKNIKKKSFELLSTQDKKKESFYKTWWFWTLTGIFLGGSFGGYFLYYQKDQLPDSEYDPINVSR